MFKEITIIGLGLIGSSIARDVKALEIAEKIIGVDTSEDNGVFLRDEEKVIDEFYNNVSQLKQISGLVILASSPASFAEIMQKISSKISTGTLIMDIGSVKTAAIAAIAPLVPAGSFYIPAHPIAGSHKSGAQAGIYDLFKNKRVILTPTSLSFATQKASQFWEKLGAKIEIMEAEKHDRIYAHVSHLPQLIAYASNKLLPKDESDFLRLAKSNPALWQDICLNNREMIISGLQNYLHILSHIITELRTGENIGENQTGDISLAIQVFPRLAASCLISTIDLCEKKYGIPLARYAGTGFASIAAPAMQPPEKDLEIISKNWQEVVELLTRFENEIRNICLALQENNSEKVQDWFTQATSSLQ